MPSIETLLNVEDEVTQVLSDLGVTEKLNEMDDFMNQNELKVQITNENATVTGLVTYTCTVKDKDNHALANRVVEWYKGTTLLGMDATDNNGVSTFRHRVTEADIYDVHAVVRGTHAGDDIRMFVKDKDNLFNYAQWSMGDYDDSIINNLGASSQRIEITSEWCVNGYYGVKLTILSSSTQFMGIRTSNILGYIGKQLQFSVDVNTGHAIKISIYRKVNGSFVGTNVDIPSGSSSATITSPIIEDDCEELWFRLDGNNLPIGSSFYTDNWMLIIP